MLSSRFMSFIFYCARPKTAGLILCMVALAAQVQGAEPTSPARFAFVSNPYDYVISGYTVDEAGLLQPNGGTFVGTKYPAMMGVHPSGKFVYTASRTVDTIHIYKVDPGTGLLAEISGSPIDGVVRSPFSMVFHPTGKFMFMAARSGYVSAYKVDSKTGMVRLVPGGIAKSGERTRNLTIHPTGNFIFATNAYTNDISVFRVSQKTGVLTEIPGSPFNAGENSAFDDTYAPLLDVPDGAGGLPYYITVHPSGKFAYVTNWKAASISVFSINITTGELTLVGRPVLTGLTPYAVAAHPSGKYLYAGSWASNDIWGYNIDPKTGELTLFKSGAVETKSAKPVAIRFNQQGTMAYVASTATNTASVMKLDVATGKLTLVQNIRARGGALDIGVVPGKSPVSRLGNLAFLINAKDATLRVNRVDRFTGKFTEISKARVGDKPVAVAHDPLNRFVYVANSGSNSVSAFRVNKQSGQLTEVEGSPYKVGEEPVEIAADSFGWYLYVRNRKSNDAHVFLMHVETGQLAEVRESPIGFKDNVNDMVLDRTARLAYFTSAKSKNISVYRHLRSVTAAVFEIEKFGSPFGIYDVPVSMAIHPGGFFGAIINKSGSTVRIHHLHHGTGGIENTDGPAVSVCQKPESATFDPLGDYLYVACPSSKKISIVHIDKISGAISLVMKEMDSSVAPTAIVNDPAGSFLYVVGREGQPIEQFRRDTETGKLTSQGTMKGSDWTGALSVSSVNR